MANKKLRVLTEGAILIALAEMLSLLPLFKFPWGGSVDLGMLPIIIFCVRHGFGPGMLATTAHGILQALLSSSGGFVGWQSFLGDYLVAYMAMGLGGLFRDRIANKGTALMCGSLVALGARFATHILSGYLLFSGWAEWYFTQEGFPAWGGALVNAVGPVALGWIYSAVYNGMYMVPEMIFTAVAAVLIAKVPHIVEKV